MKIKVARRASATPKSNRLYLYGTHPTVARTYAVASIKTVGAVATAYYLRKHHHSILWSLPLIGSTASSLQGTTQNMMVCN